MKYARRMYNIGHVANHSMNIIDDVLYVPPIFPTLQLYFSIISVMIKQSRRAETQ